MILKPKILLYIITVAVLIAAIVWEYYIQQWLSFQPNGGEDVMRTDLFVIWPVVITLVSVSLFRIFKKE
jgi:membrane protease YdiL (CAAX protease family)